MVPFEQEIENIVDTILEDYRHGRDIDRIDLFKQPDKDIIIDIPTNTVEMTLTLKVYTDGEIQECERRFDMQDIRDAEQTFTDCIDGKYPLYAMTDKVKELFDDDELPY